MTKFEEYIKILYSDYINGTTEWEENYGPNKVYNSRRKEYQKQYHKLYYQLKKQNDKKEQK